MTLTSCLFGITANFQDSVRAVGTPFPREQGIVFVSQGSPTRLYESFQISSTNTANFFPIGPVQTITYNAMGFNPTDMYLYAINTSTDRLIQIDSTGATVGLGSTPVTGLPSSGTGSYNSGSIGDCDYPTLNVLWVSAASATRTIYGIDVTTARVVRTVTLSQQIPNLADFVCMKDPSSGNNYLWGVYGGGGNTAAAPNGMWRINVATGQTDWFSLAGLTNIIWNGAGFGAQWLYGNGNIGISNNSSGNIHQIIINNPGSLTPTFEEAAMLHGPASTTNDGASYAGDPIDLSVEKTATTDYGVFGPADSDGVYTPGGNITYTLTITNQETNITSSGFYVTDVLDANLTNVSFDNAGCYVSDVSVLGETAVTCTYGVLEPGQSVSFKIYATTPTPPTVPMNYLIINNATVVGNEADPNPTNNTSAIKTTAANYGYTVSKEAITDSHVIPGDVITYVVSITNTGAASYAGLNLADFIDDLSDVLDDATYNDNAVTATNADGSEVIEFDGTNLLWSGALAVGETKIVTYSVTIDIPDLGNKVLVNSVSATHEEGSCGGICSTQTLVGIPSYTIEKNVDKTTITPNGSLPNDLVNYVVTITNIGTAPYTTDYPIEIEDDLSDVLDDAVFGNSIDATTGIASIRGLTLYWSGPLDIGEIAHITYQVRVNIPDTSTDGNLIMINSIAPAGANPDEGVCLSCTTQTAVTARIHDDPFDPQPPTPPETPNTGFMGTLGEELLFIAGIWYVLVIIASVVWFTIHRKRSES